MDNEIYIDDLKAQKISKELEHAIRDINKEQIRAQTGKVKKEAFLKVAEKASKIRAQYLAKVIELGCTEGLSGDDIVTLKKVRAAYEEAVHGFQALEHALSRGYIDLD